MSEKRNIYIVLTEYQFLQSVNISINKYSSDEYINKIYVVRNGIRLMGLDENKKMRLDNLQVYILENKKPKEIVGFILNENPDHFFIFQANSPINVFLGYTLAKKNVEISLGPDGYSLYNIYNKEHAFFSLVKDSVYANLFLIKNMLFRGKVYRFDYYKYGNQKFINNIWVTHPEQYIHQTKYKTEIIRLPDFNQKTLEFVRSCFDYNESFPTENVIYYFGHSYVPELIKAEFDFLNGVLDNFPKNDIIVKLHPRASKEYKELFQSIERIKIIESTVPAEIIIASLKNCIVFSMMSSVLMMENKSCNYYFNYPIYKNSNYDLLDQSEIIVLDHIKLIDKPELMRFPNE